MPLNIQKSQKTNLKSNCIYRHRLIKKSKKFFKKILSLRIQAILRSTLVEWSKYYKQLTSPNPWGTLFFSLFLDILDWRDALSLLQIMNYIAHQTKPLSLPLSLLCCLLWQNWADPTVVLSLTGCCLPSPARAALTLSVTLLSPYWSAEGIQGCDWSIGQ